MGKNVTLADLLSEYMQASGFGDARLAKQVNRVIGHPDFLHRSTIRNWRTGTSKRVRDWRQLVAIADVLNLSELKTNRLLNIAGLPAIHKLRMQANDREKKFFYSSVEATLSESSVKKFTVKETLEAIRYYETNLIIGKDVEISARWLGDIAIERKKQEAMLSLWKAICETSNLAAIMDPCAYTIGRIIWETLDPMLEEIGFDILNNSVDTNSELIIDKFAYVLGEIVLHTKKAKTRERAWQFVNDNALNSTLLVREKYTFTKNRITHLLADSISDSG